ncbi:hypothetical protein NE236_36800 [Actinoallomurus purpureus]|uniref:hypothetical protein n=1 Tax=Actinoallomurus purpureus TaxID=478114 RepID=UPI00209238B1|nr:hypothetical protein [Actinoallomurus purpureus]MCO6010532.1 hypothetical protein [Actinoallomurus purpureus]
MARVRRLANQAFFEKLLVTDDLDGVKVAGAVIREPWASLLAEDLRSEQPLNATNLDPVDLGRGSKMMTLVPRRDTHHIYGATTGIFIRPAGHRSTSSPQIEFRDAANQPLPAKPNPTIIGY